MLKTLLKFIIWQSDTKPTKWYEYLLSLFHWVFVIFFEFVIIIGFSQLKINYYTKYFLTFWFAINTIFWGSTVEYTGISNLKRAFFGLAYAIRKAREQKTNTKN